MNPDNPPKVLCLAGLDATGGAGLQADIESIASIGAHALPVLTANTIQNTSNVIRMLPVEANTLRDQVDTLLDDVTPDAIKIGLLGSAAIARVVADLLDRCPRASVVLDPVRAAGGGAVLADDALREVIVEQLLPRTLLTTPNTSEVCWLAGGSAPPLASADALVARGCKAVLLTGTHDATDDVIHHLRSNAYEPAQWTFRRLAGEYHGSGCTLSAAVAALLALGLQLPQACTGALEYTDQSLRRAFRIGRGQNIPGRTERNKCTQ